MSIQKSSQSCSTAPRPCAQCTAGSEGWNGGRPIIIIHNLEGYQAVAYISLIDFVHCNRECATWASPHKLRRDHYKEDRLCSNSALLTKSQNGNGKAHII